MISKNLPATTRHTQGEDPPAEFNWILNEQGYPLNARVNNDLIYTYACEE
ncbi:hypothetical protein Q0590_26050 [Rhodocytophaga aerolata]|uniref:Uncharacterized protein n=1 Tax=Rhodocytophaga aerolata TaxID=455078 RepID=A0ABT8REZ8_9BACT|nr:hypothetical protein [Rhodocytophaga aerolata]MDO1449768.1 hypothetical protein [Rhodocytophaga aerolata]